jgi:hypothetical protein
MTTEPPRWRRFALALAPIWLAHFDRWQARRAKERQRALRILDRMANGDTPPMPPEPRTVDNIFIRMNRPREPWRVFADSQLDWRAPLATIRRPRRGET